jgi:hypothetical protein
VISNEEKGQAVWGLREAKNDGNIGRGCSYKVQVGLAVVGFSYLNDNRSFAGIGIVQYIKRKTS